jgi:hypothetical protein
VNCIPVLTCQLHQGLIAQGDHLTSRCQSWTEGQQSRPPLSPREGWLSDGRQGHISAVPHFLPRAEALILAANQQRIWGSEARIPVL